jgi:hypothetical protein
VIGQLWTWPLALLLAWQSAVFAGAPAAARWRRAARAAPAGARRLWGVASGVPAATRRAAPPVPAPRHVRALTQPPQTPHARAAPAPFKTPPPPGLLALYVAYIWGPGLKSAEEPGPTPLRK